MTIHHHKFYGIDKQNRVRLKIAITIILDVSFIILNSFWYKSVNETLNIKAAVRGLKMPPLFWSTCEEAGKPLICWYLSSVEYSWFTVIWSEFYRSWRPLIAIFYYLLIWRVKTTRSYYSVPGFLLGINASWEWFGLL